MLVRLSSSPRLNVRRSWTIRADALGAVVGIGEGLREVRDARLEPGRRLGRELTDEHLELAGDELEVREHVGERIC